MAHETPRLHTLEKALQAWEEHWFLAKLNIDYAKKVRTQAHFPETGPVLNYGSFRQFLLSLHSRTPDMELDDFSLPRDHPDAGMWLDELPEALAHWCYQSRRIYTLSQELMLLLESTSLENVTLDDIEVPFPCYAVALPHGMSDSRGRQFRFCVLSIFENDDERRFLKLWIFSEDHERFEPSYTKRERNELFKKLRRGKIDYLTRFFQRESERKEPKGLTLTMPLEEDAPIAGYCQTMRERYEIPAERHFTETEDQLADHMLRIALGLSLYLQSKPGQEPSACSTRPVERADYGPAAVTDAGDVCHVQNTITLSAETRAFLDHRRGSHGSPQCHFREGHWRRPPGTAHDPQQPKTVWVCPTIVRADRLDNEELPAGASSKL